MKYTASISIAALLSVGSAWADETPAYYDYEVFPIDNEGENYGPFPSAISESGDLISAYAFRAQLTQDTDIGLPFTFNQACFFDDDICELQFYGSENEDDLSFENAYQAWRNAMSEIDSGETSPISYFLAGTFEITGNSGGLGNEALGDSLPIEGFGELTDVKITDVVELASGASYTIGYGSAPYDSDANRDFVRRAFITEVGNNAASISLLPTEFEDEETDDYGGFSSAYKMREITFTDSVDDSLTFTKTLIIGHTSQSFASDSTTYFDNCYNSDETNYRFSNNDLDLCPGFDTQAWAWAFDEATVVDGDELSGFALATEWLDDDRDGSDATYSAAAFDINNVGIAVGTSTFEYFDGETGARQRAIIMEPATVDGTEETVTYEEPTQLTLATSGVSDQDDSIYNTWAETITDYDELNSDNSNIIMGNREFSITKGRNNPIEMFIYDYDNDEIAFPFVNKKVQSTRQRLDNDSAALNGANSYGYDMNNNGLVVGKADAYNEFAPVTDGNPRNQSAFLYDNNTDASWFVEDLMCSENANGEIIKPLIRLRSATAINDEGDIVAEGFQYASDEDYKFLLNATPIIVKLTATDINADPNSSPNCWNSDVLQEVDENFERSGAASFWLWLFALPLLLIRRFIK